MEQTSYNSDRLMEDFQQKVYVNTPEETNVSSIAEMNNNTNNTEVNPNITSENDTINNLKNAYPPSTSVNNTRSTTCSGFTQQNLKLNYNYTLPSISEEPESQVFSNISYFNSSPCQKSQHPLDALTNIQLDALTEFVFKQRNKRTALQITPTQRLLTGEEREIQRTFYTVLSDHPFPRYPTFHKYITWRTNVLKILGNTHIKDDSILFDMLVACFKGGLPLSTYTTTQTMTQNKPQERLIRLFKTLDAQYGNIENQRNHWQKVYNFIPKGNGYIIANNYSRLYFPSDDLMETCAYVTNLHHKFPANIQKKINYYFEGKLPQNLEDYLDAVRDVITFNLDCSKIINNTTQKNNYTKKQNNNNNNQNNNSNKTFIPYYKKKFNNNNNKTFKPYVNKFKKFNNNYNNNNKINNNNNNTNKNQNNNNNIKNNQKNNNTNNKQNNNKNANNNNNNTQKNNNTKTNTKQNKENTKTFTPSSAKINAVWCANINPKLQLHNNETTVPLLLTLVKIKNKQFTALVDYGCQVILLSSRIATQLTIETIQTYMKISSINKEFDTVAKTKDELTLTFFVESLNTDVAFTSHFYITELPEEFDIILGLPFIKTLDPHVHKLQIGAYKLQPLTITTENKKDIKQVLAITEKVFGLEEEDTVSTGEEKIKLISETINSNELETLLNQYQCIFTDSFVALPPKRNIQHAIQLVDNPQFRKKPIFRLSEEKLQYIKKLINELLEIGLIRESNSNITANGFLVPKKTGGYRLCIDYVELNKNTVKDNYPLPRIEDLHDRLVGAKYFSKIDLQSGYYQIRMKEEDIHKTAFVTRYGSYEFLVMPFGLCNAPATFQKLMHEVLFEFLDRFVVVYLDDILIYSKTYHEHLHHLDLVFQQLKQYSLYMNKPKCEFAKTKLQYLGFIVSNNGLETEESKVKAVQDWPTPFKIIHDVRAFLGLSGYYRRFIKNYAHIVAPLTELLKADSPRKWTQRHTNAVNTIKQAMTKAPVLALPDYSKQFFVYTDASSYAIGAQLTQHFDQGERPIAFASRKLHGAELRYSTYDKEMLAILFAIDKWQVYLAEKEFIIYTDHKPLQYLITQKVLNARQQRWLVKLNNYKFIIKHIDGNKNVVADALSRRPDFEQSLLCTIITEITENGIIPHILQEYKNFPDFTKVEYPGVLLESNKDGLLLLPPQTDFDAHRIVIPRYATTLQDRLLYEHHNTVYSAHTGVYKTHKLLTQKFYWRGIQNSVKKYVSHCDVCQRSKRPSGKIYGLLQALPIPKRPWEVISMDFVTNLPVTQEDNDTLFVVVDKFSKMIHLIPMKQTNDASTVAMLFRQHVYKLHGLPKVIISDRDPRFTSSFWQTLFKYFRTKLHMSTAYHPQTDGQTEIMNKITQTMLRTVLQSNIDEWDKYIADIEFAYNNTVSQSTGYTPFYLNSAQHPLTPIDINLARKEINRDVEQFIKHMQKIYNNAHNNLLKAQKAQKHFADKKRQFIQFHVDEYALVASKCFATQYKSHKFDYQYVGPFKICKVLNDNAYILYVTQELGTYKTCNVSSLKKYIGIPTICDVVHDKININQYINEHLATCKYHSDTQILTRNKRRQLDDYNKARELTSNKRIHLQNNANIANKAIDSDVEIIIDDSPETS